MLACPRNFYHCYSRHFVDNLRQRPRRRGFPEPLQDLSSKPQVTRNMQPSTHSPDTYPPNTYPMIRANLLEPILEAIRAQDHDPAEPSAQPRVTPGPHRPLSIHSPGQIRRTVRAGRASAPRSISRPQDWARLSGRSYSGRLGFIFQASANLRQALLQLSAYVSVWQSATRVELIAGDTTADYIYQIADPSLRPRRQDAEYSMASICSLIRNFLGDQWAPMEVHFEHAGPPGNRRAYTQALHAPVFFGQNINRLSHARRRSRSRRHLVRSIDDSFHGTSSARSGPGEQGTGELRPPGQLPDRPPPRFRPVELCPP